MKSVIIIPSRMASSRLPGKPLIKIDGIPMIQRVWHQAVSSNLGDVYVACCETEVFDLIQNNGGNAIFTNPNLPSGTDRVYSAFSQIENASDIDCIINLQGDMPLIKPNHIKKVIEPLKNNFLIGTLATSLRKDEFTSPNITKVLVNWKNNNIGEAKEFFRSKNVRYDQAFHHVGIYSYTKESLMQFVDLPKSINEISLNLEQYRAMDSGMRIGIKFEPDIPLSIDTKEDLISAENIIKEINEKN